MVFLESLGVALSAYSALPVPQFTWNERNMRYAICFFPAVGLLCGGGLLLWVWLAGALAVSPLFFGAAAVCLPLFITGGIHMDGYMDTVDALASRQPRERKLDILKDPNCGAFAVIWCGVYLLLSLGFYHELYGRGSFWALALTFVVSRGLSALCAVTMPNARGSGMLCAFTEPAQKTGSAAAMAVLVLLAGGAMIWLSPGQGGLSLGAALLTALWYRRMAKREFGGATGDTAGFFLQVCELAMLAGVWLGGVL